MTPPPRKPAEDAPACHARLHGRARGWPMEAFDDAPAHEAWRLLFRFLQAMKETFPALVAEFDLSPVQARVLLELDPETPVPMSALAQTLACDASNVTGLVDRLEARGLIERRSDEHDRRVKIIAVTAAGAALRDKVLRRLAKPPAEVAALDAADQRALARILRGALEP